MSRRRTRVRKLETKQGVADAIINIAEAAKLTGAEPRYAIYLCVRAALLIDTYVASETGATVGAELLVATRIALTDSVRVSDGERKAREPSERSTRLAEAFEAAIQAALLKDPATSQELPS